jgi:hypothetical protein
MKKAVTCLLIIVFTVLCHDSFSQPNKRSRSILKRDLELSVFTMNFNLLGLALYGPVIQAEFKVADQLFVVPWFRYSYAGIASQYEWTNFEDDSKYYPSSLALGLGVKAFIFIKSKRQMVYYGGFGEFIHEKGLYNMNTNYEYERTRLAIAVYGNLGYRWTSKRNFYFDLGILPGFAFDIKNEGLYHTGASEGLPYPGIQKKNRVVGMIDCAFGWNLKL